MTALTWDPRATAVFLALPELAAFTAPWRATSYAPDQPNLTVERRFPPHVTVLAPFASADDLEAIGRLRTIAARHRALDLRFERAEQFEPGGAVWLAPEPAAQVMALLTDVIAGFPDHPPYGGRHLDPVPHLTVTTEGDARTLAQVRSSLAQSGPLDATVTELGVWQRDENQTWQLVATAPLGAA